MKQFKLLFFFAFLASIICIPSCMKMDPGPPEPPEPPEEPMLTDTTKTGENTLSFLLNDEVWIADRGWGDMSSNISVASKTWRTSTKRFVLNGGTDNFNITITLNDWNPSMYKYSDHDKLRDSFFSFGKEKDDCIKWYEIDTQDSFNFMEVTHVERSQTTAFEQWISGSFQFRMIEEFEGGCGDTIYITDGRFDMRFQAI